MRGSDHPTLILTASECGSPHVSRVVPHFHVSRVVQRSHVSRMVPRFGRGKKKLLQRALRTRDVTNTDLFANKSSCPYKFST